MPQTRSRLLAAAVCFTLVPISLLAAPPDRITEPVNDTRVFQLDRAVRSRIATAPDLGAVSPDLELLKITVYLSLSAAQQRGLDALVAAQQDRSSPLYHQWLSPEEYAGRFGASKHDISEIVTWLRNQGFHNVQESRSRTRITFAGSAAMAEAAFRTSLHRYQIAGEAHYANSAPPVLPHAFQNLIHNIGGLDDFRPHPMLHRAALRPHFSTGSYNLVAPADFFTIYNVPANQSGSDGSGVSIAIPGQSDITLSQVSAFRSAAGLSAQTIQIKLAGTDPGVQADAQVEAYADVEWAGAAASKAQIIYMPDKSAFDAVEYAIDNNVAPILSMSFGVCETDIANNIDDFEQTFEQAASQGMTVIASSGDFGPSTCDSGITGETQVTEGLTVDYPASSQYVTGVGGTMFTGICASGLCWSGANTAYGGSATGYETEQVWNETSQNILASGGGSSSVVAKPAWQTGPGVPPDGQRDVPDVAFDASVNTNPYIVCADDGTVPLNGSTPPAACSNGFLGIHDNLTAVGGTSLSAQAFAGIVAILVQQQGRQGNINPHLYAFAASNPNDFHDVTIGDNYVPCAPQSTDCPAGGQLGYSAASGYDMATGLGSVDAAQLLGDWNPDFSLALTLDSITAAAGSSASTSLTVDPVGNFTSEIAFTCSVSSALTSTTCTVPTSLLANSSGTVTISNGNASHIMAPSRAPRVPPSSYVFIFAAACFAVFAYRKPRFRFATAVVCLCACVCLPITSCGGGSSESSPAPQPHVTGTVTITGTSNGKSHSVTLTVTET